MLYRLLPSAKPPHRSSQNAAQPFLASVIGVVLTVLGWILHLSDRTIFHRDSFAHEQMYYLHNSSESCSGDGLR